MNLLLGIGDWFAQNWMILVLIVVTVGLLVPTYLRQKKDAAARNELHEKLVKGTKIITTAGVYGVIESVENTTDGKVVTIVTGNGKYPSTMTIHINAIGGIDNKSSVVEEAVTVEETEVVSAEDEAESDANKISEIEEAVAAKPSKKKSK